MGSHPKGGAKITKTMFVLLVVLHSCFISSTFSVTIHDHHSSLVQKSAVDKEAAKVVQESSRSVFQNPTSENPVSAPETVAEPLADSKSNPTPEGVPSKSNQNKPNSIESVFQIQLVGASTSALGLPQPGPLYQTSGTATTSKCLHALDPVKGIEGIPIQFVRCELSEFATQKFDPDKRKKQEFIFTSAGKIASKLHGGYCVRRKTCAEQTVYDLGPCDEENVAIFEVGIQERNGANVKNLGRPLQAMRSEDPLCKNCGPFQLWQFCKSGTVEGNGTCQMGEYDTWSSLTGWTKGRETDQGITTHYLPATFLSPRSPTKTSSLFEPSNWGSSADGLTSMKAGVCGSFVGDGAMDTSYFYFRKL